MADDGPTTDPLPRLHERGSAKWRVHPPDVLPLTIAEMDFALAAPIREVLHDAIDRGDTGYPWVAPMLGDALAGFAADRWGWDLDPADVSATPDVSVGVVQLLREMTKPGDTVVINPPVYPPFFDWIPEAHARILEVPLRRTGDGWRLDLPAMARAFATRPAAYILCNPHNPVGRIHATEELTAVIELANRYQVPIIADEIHGPLALPGAAFTPILTLPGAADIAIAVHSASKAWNLAGLKCAMIVAAAPATRAVIDRLPPDNQYRVGHFGVLASVAALNDARDWLDQVLVELDQRRTQLGERLRARLPMIDWRPPEATYLAWLDCTALGEGTEPHQRFLTAGRVAFEPGPRFGAIGSGHVRLNFATSAAVLDEAITRMATALPERAGEQPAGEETL